MRKVRGLKDVQEVAPPGNRRGGTAISPSAADGLRYERHLALYAASLGFRVKHGQWFKFRDSKGVAYCQTDVLCLPELKDRILVLEAKLTQTAEGEVKLKRLYVPVVRKLYGLPVFPIMVFRNILVPADRHLDRLESALSLPMREQEKVYHLHWSAL